MGSSRSPCPLDSEFADQIAALLASPPPQSAKDYYEKLIEETKYHGIRVKDDNRGGKGVYADMEFKEGELVLKDEIFVAAQHSSNRVDCLVCSRCFCYIGSIELQIGRKLFLQDVGLSGKSDHHHGIRSSISEEDYPADFDEDEDIAMENGNVGLSAHRTLKDNSLSKEILGSLTNGGLSLPYTNQFVSPPVIACPGGCEEEHYCSKLCADSDWESSHSLLCTGANVGSSRRAALLKFIEHANNTNDIFILAAKVISYTVLKYKKLRGHHLEDGKQKTKLDSMNGSNFALLMEAWKPISMGFKRRWWDCIALPDDVPVCDEILFRLQIRDLAFDSVQLLKDAIFEKECAPLFSLEIYGHIIGMFELNNLDLVVASPIEDYFIYIDDLPFPEKEEAEKVTKPFLDALGDEYSVCCEGTAFFPLQSCMNHSCCPNAKAFKRDEDRDGRATIIALQPISKGEEITISYIDEELSFGERRALLADYGFRCCCEKCSKERGIH